MDLAKFIWILQNKSLYFACLTNMDDLYEGYPTKWDATVGNEIRINYIDHSIRRSGEPIPIQNIRALIDKTSDSVTQERRERFVSCWHINEAESAAMWRLYTSTNEAICIRTTYEKLATLLPEQCMLGMVNYKDYNHDSHFGPNANIPAMTKRLSFSFEQEARALIWKPRFGADRLSDIAGIPIGIDTSQLIESVYIAPSAPPMLLPIIECLLKTYAINAKVFQSGVNSPPDYLV